MTEQPNAKIEDIRRLAGLAKDHGGLCGLFAGTSRACEAETMVEQTLHACVVNYDREGEPFSFRGDGVLATGGAGLVDNATAYKMLCERGYFVEGRRGDILPVIFVAQALVDLLDRHFSAKSETRATLTEEPQRCAWPSLREQE